MTSATPRLPEPDQREWLLGRLAALVARAGWDRFVLARLVEPNETFFPDRYHHDARGVRTIARRLLRHAGLEELGVVIEDLIPPEDERADQLLPETLIHLVGVEDDVIELEVQSLGPPEDLALVLSHLIARAARRHRGLHREPEHPYRGALPSDVAGGEEDEELEAAMASIFEVYLSFGLLAANGAHGYRAAGRTLGRDVETAWVHERTGGLEAPDVCFLLAVQLVVRGASAAEIARARGLLRVNQAADLGGWVDALRGEGDVLRARLGIPAPESWGEPWMPDLTLLPLDDASARTDGPVRAPKTRALWNDGRPVFRVRRTRAHGAMALGGLVGTAVAIVVGLAVDLGLAGSVGVPALGLVAGFLVGSGRRNDFCSDPRCEHALSADAETCAGCGGRVSGEIASASERLAAEEALEDDDTAARDDHTARDDEEG